MKTVRRPPYPKWNPGYFPCSSLIPLPLSSRRPSVSFGGFGIRQLQSFPFRAPKASELPPQRLRFAIQLIKAAGYKGWVVLLDELELVGSYSLLQRGRSYAEVTRWMGQAAGEAYPGLVVVGTVTDDFATAVIGADGKKDRDYVGPRLRARNDDAVAARSEAGMRLIEREAVPLNPPSDADVNATVQKLRNIYSVAYSWDAPSLEVGAGGAGYRNRMRYKVRASINQWDLLRLYPDSRPETEGDEYRHTYEEDADLERESKPESTEGGRRVSVLKRQEGAPVLLG